VFSAAYAGIHRVRKHNSGAVGRVLDKEMGKDFWYRFFLNISARPASLSHPFLSTALRRRSHGDGRRPPSLTGSALRRGPSYSGQGGFAFTNRREILARLIDPAIVLELTVLRHYRFAVVKCESQAIPFRACRKHV